MTAKLKQANTKGRQVSCNDCSVFFFSFMSFIVLKHSLKSKVMLKKLYKLGKHGNGCNKPVVVSRQ